MKSNKIIVFVLISIILLTSIPIDKLFVNAVGETVTLPKSGRIITLPSDISSSKNIGGTNYDLNLKLLEDRRIIVYGDHIKISQSSTTDYKNDEWRYLGYDAVGNKYRNNWFPRDADSGRHASQKDWIFQPWYKDLVYESSYYRDNDTRLGKWLQSMDWYEEDRQGKSPSEYDEEYLIERFHLQSPPTKYTQGTATGWHMSSGKVWYQTFIIPPTDELTFLDESPEIYADMDLHTEVFEYQPTGFKNKAYAIGTEIDHYHLEIFKSSTLIKEYKVNLNDYDTSNPIYYSSIEDVESDLKNGLKQGTYTFEYTVDNGSGLSSTIIDTLTVIQEDPGKAIAVETIQDKAIIGEDYIVSASNSMASKGAKIIQWQHQISTDGISWTDISTDESFTESKTTEGIIYYRVKVWDTNGVESDWSAPVSIEIYNNVIIEAHAEIDVPDEVYQGIPFNVSTSGSYVTVDGKRYSLKRAVELGYATYRISGVSKAPSEKLDADGGMGVINSIGERAVTLRIYPQFGDSVKDTDYTFVRETPIAILKLNGDSKENRLITFDGTDSIFSLSNPIDITKAYYEVKKLDTSTTVRINYGQVIDNSFIRTQTFNSLSLDTIFKIQGGYEVTLYVESNNGKNDITTNNISIREDKVPFVDFSMSNKIYKDTTTNKGVVNITSLSKSTDNDFIGYRQYYYKHDSDNDGLFNDESWVYAGISYDDTFTIQVDKLGKYQVLERAKESFNSPTIESFVDSTHRKQAEKIKEFEYDNHAPMTAFSLIPYEFADIYFITENTRESTLNSKMGTFQNNLSAGASYGLNSNVKVDSAEIGGSGYVNEVYIDKSYENLTTVVNDLQAINESKFLYEYNSILHIRDFDNPSFKYEKRVDKYILSSSADEVYGYNERYVAGAYRYYNSSTSSTEYRIWLYDALEEKEIWDIETTGTGSYIPYDIEIKNNIIVFKTLYRSSYSGSNHRYYFKSRVYNLRTGEMIHETADNYFISHRDYEDLYKNSMPNLDWGNRINEYNNLILIQDINKTFVYDLNTSSIKWENTTLTDYQYLTNEGDYYYLASEANNSLVKLNINNGSIVFNSNYENPANDFGIYRTISDTSNIYILSISQWHGVNSYNISYRTAYLYSFNKTSGAKNFSTQLHTTTDGKLSADTYSEIRMAFDELEINNLLFDGSYIHVTYNWNDVYKRYIMYGINKSNGSKIKNKTIDTNTSNVEIEYSNKFILMGGESGYYSTFKVLDFDGNIIFNESKRPGGTSSNNGLRAKIDIDILNEQNKNIVAVTYGGRKNDDDYFLYSLYDLSAFTELGNVETSFNTKYWSPTMNAIKWFKVKDGYAFLAGKAFPSPIIKPGIFTTETLADKYQMQIGGQYLGGDVGGITTPLGKYIGKAVNNAGFGDGFWIATYKIQQSFFSQYNSVFDNITWENTENKYVVILVNNLITYSTSELNSFINKLNTNDIKAIFVGNSQNQTLGQQLASSTGGVYYSTTNMDTALTQIKNYIITDINNNPETPTMYVKVNEEVNYTTKYFDIESNPEDSSAGAMWKYVHTPNGDGLASFHNQWLTAPITKFTKDGTYRTYFLKRDLPTTDLRFTNYRKWSSDKNYMDIIVGDADTVKEIPLSLDLNISGTLIQNHRVDFQISAIEGTNPINWSSLDITISGSDYKPYVKPNAKEFSRVFSTAGNKSITVKLSDNKGNQVSRTFSFTINSDAIPNSSFAISGDGLRNEEGIATFKITDNSNSTDDSIGTVEYFIEDSAFIDNGDGTFSPSGLTWYSLPLSDAGEFEINKVDTIRLKQRVTEYYSNGIGLDGYDLDQYRIFKTHESINTTIINNIAPSLEYTVTPNIVVKGDNIQHNITVNDDTPFGDVVEYRFTHNWTYYQNSDGLHANSGAITTETLTNTDLKGAYTFEARVKDENGEYSSWIPGGTVYVVSEPIADFEITAKPSRNYGEEREIQDDVFKKDTFLTITNISINNDYLDTVASKGITYYKVEYRDIATDNWQAVDSMYPDYSLNINNPYIQEFNFSSPITDIGMYEIRMTIRSADEIEAIEYKPFKVLDLRLDAELEPNTIYPSQSYKIKATTSIDATGVVAKDHLGDWVTLNKINEDSDNKYYELNVTTLETLADADYNIEVYAMYPFNNEAQQDLALTVNTPIQLNTIIIPIAPVEYSGIEDNTPNATQIKVPASESINIAATVTSPISITQVEAILEGESGSVSLTDDDNNGIWTGIFPIREDKQDSSKRPNGLAYEFRIKATAINTSYKENTHKVNASTPINLITNMLESVYVDDAAIIGASSTKYVDAINVTIFRGTAFEVSYNMTSVTNGNLKDWTKSYTIPDTIPEGSYTAEFRATTPNGNVEVETETFNVETLQVSATLVPNPALAGDELIFTVDTKGYVERIEIDVDPDIIAKDDRVGKYNYPTLSFNVNGSINEKSDILKYILSVWTDQSLNKDNVRLRPQYTFKIRGYKGTNFKEVELKLDVRRSVLDLLHPGVRMN